MEVDRSSTIALVFAKDENIAQQSMDMPRAYWSRQSGREIVRCVRSNDPVPGLRFHEAVIKPTMALAPIWRDQQLGIHRSRLGRCSRNRHTALPKSQASPAIGR